MPEVKQLLFLISNALLWPCIVLLGAFFAMMLYWLGAVFREMQDRRTAARVIAGLFAAPNLAAAVRAVDSARVDGPWRRVLSALAAERPTRVDLEKHVRDAETAMTRRVEGVSVASKVGPMLGLLGTLIPLGPALEALGRGSTKELADSLMVSFATTVVGLAIAGPCFWIATMRRRWYEQDLSDMENLADRLLGDEPEAAR